MRYEWNETKRVENLEKHGIDFRAIGAFDWSVSETAVDARRNYGEVRILAFGPIHGRLHVVVYTRRGDVRRLISLRKANRREQAEYAAAVLARLARG